MRTNQDLQGAFALLEEQADAYGAPEITVAGSKPARPRRERGHVRRNAFALAVTAAVVGGGIYVATSMGKSGGDGRPSGPPPAAGPTPSPVKLQFNFAVNPIAGAHVTLNGVDRKYQTADVFWDTGGAGATLTVYAPHAFDPRQVEAHGTPTSVGKHQGYFSTPLDTSVEPNNGMRAPILAWQYGHDSWATVKFQGTDTAPTKLKEKAVTLAEAVRTGVSTVLRLPFKIGYLPPHLVPELAFVLRSAGSGRIGLSDGVQADDLTLGGLSIQAIEYATGSETPCEKRVTVQGTKACFRNMHEYAENPRSRVVGRELSFTTSARLVTVTIDRSHLALYSDDDLVKIAQSLTFAGSMTDYNTWFDARTVLPH
jgi:hypothetical protein